MFDILSFIMGIKKGTGRIELSEDSHYVFKDENNDGNIEIEESEDE